MNPIFIDTSFLIALVFTDDPLHARTQAWQEAAKGPLLTTEFVLLEFADALSEHQDRDLAESTINELRANPDLEILPFDPELYAQGWEFFIHRRDKNWQLTDCISFEAMMSRGATEALTYDHHFEQAGFRALLRHDVSR